MSLLSLMLLRRRQREVVAQADALLHDGYCGPDNPPGTLRIVMEGGVVKAVFFRRTELPFEVTGPTGGYGYGRGGLPRIRAVELVD